MTRYCTNCGAQVAEGAAFCASCGAPVAGGVHVSATVNAGPTNGKAIASLVCGIAGLLVLPVVLSVVALVLGYGARREIKERPGQSGDGQATAGIVLGWIGVAWGLLIVFFFVVIAVGTMSHMNP